MAELHELACAMNAVTVLRKSPDAHINTLRAAERRLRKVALECDTIHGADDPNDWAANWLESCSSGFPFYPRMAEIAAAFRSVTAPRSTPAPAFFPDPEHFTGHRAAFQQEAA